MDESIDLLKPDALNGWKEIATFLGKSVRAVQRWERDFGLPVHRIKTPAGQAVYAFKAEIDAWRRQMDERETEPAGDAALAPAANSSQGSAPAGSPLQPLRVLPRYAWISAVATIVVVLAASFWWSARTARAAVPPLDFRFTGQFLHVIDGRGSVVWSYDFGWPLQGLKENFPQLGRGISADIDGDGRRETIAVVHVPGTGGEPWRESVFCFSDTGQLQWSYTPDFQLAFEGRVFEGPWRNYTIAASDGPGRQRVWAAFGHHTWWPTVVIELDDHGKATPRYFQSGAIYTLAYWKTRARAYLAAAGVDNEYSRASIALIDLDARAATSPQHPGTNFACDSCPNEGPAFFALLPRVEINRFSSSPYNVARNVTPIGTALKLATHQDGQTGDVLYLLHDDFTFHEAALSDTYWETHRIMQDAGRLDHTARDCPDLKAAHEIETWTPARQWQRMPVRFAPPGAGRQ